MTPRMFPRIWELAILCGVAVTVSALIVYQIRHLHESEHSADEKNETVLSVVFLVFMFWLSFQVKWGYEWWLTVGAADRLERLRLACLAHHDGPSAESHARDLQVFLDDLNERISADERRAVERVIGFKMPVGLETAREHGPKIMSESVFDGLAKTRDGFLGDGADRARLLYESRSLMSYAEAAFIGSISIFLPLLVFLWNSARDKLTERMHLICSAPVSQPALEKELTEQWTALNRFGQKMRPPFIVTSIAVVLLVVAFAYVNTSTTTARQQYLAAIALNSAALTLTLWLVLLLVLYLVLVQPTVGGRFDALLFSRLTVPPPSSEGDVRESLDS